LVQSQSNPRQDQLTTQSYTAQHSQTHIKAKTKWGIVIQCPYLLFIFFPKSIICKKGIKGGANSLRKEENNHSKKKSTNITVAKVTTISLIEPKQHPNQ
jgi:hypothetical protein